MKYKQLLQALQNLSDEQLEMDVLLYDVDNDESFEAEFVIDHVEDSEENEDFEESDVFDPGQPYFAFPAVEAAPRKPAPPVKSAEEIKAERLAQMAEAKRFADKLPPMNLVSKSRQVQQDLDKKKKS